MRRTGVAKRLELYSKAASKLRLAQICMSEKLAMEAVTDIVALNTRFEREDEISDSGN